MRFAIFEDDGASEAIAFQQVYTGPERKAKLQAPEGFGYAKVPNDAAPGTHYIRRETMKANQRPMTPCTLSRTTVPADGSTHVALSQMRPGTQIEIAGPASMSFVAEQSTEKITFTVPGEYTLTAAAPFPALPTTVTIRAT